MSDETKNESHSEEDTQESEEEQEQTNKDCDNEYKIFEQPDGGFGWVIVIVAFFVQFFVLGTMNNFGILFTQLLDEFHQSKQATSWVGSITYGLMFATGPIATSLTERIGCRPVAILGSLIGIIGTLLASFSDSLSKMYLTQGILFGIGASLCYFPSVIILPQYFFRKLSLANGFVCCGSGVGTMVMGPVMNYAIENYGWRTSIRVTTALLFIVTLVSCVYRPLIPTIQYGRKDTKRPFFDFSVFHNKAFLVYTLALSLFMLSYFVPFVHLTQMALEYKIPMNKASLLIGFMSVASTFGRLFFGKIADSKHINRLYMYQLSLLGIGVANTLCPLLTTFPGLLVYSALFGFFEGCYVCQVAVLTGDIVGIERMGIAVGILFGIKSIPLTLGPPLAGLLYDVSKSYQVPFYVAGAIPTLAACIMFFIPYLMPPPDDPFWIFPPSSKQYLISSSSESCTNDKNNNNGTDNVDRIPIKVQKPSNLHSGKNTHQSYTSINSFNLMPLEKKISMKDIGSISSFGSVIFSPVAKKRSINIKNSSNLLVVDRVTHV